MLQTRSASPATGGGSTGHDIAAKGPPVRHRVLGLSKLLSYEKRKATNLFQAEKHDQIYIMFRIATNYKNIFVSHISKKGLVSIIYINNSCNLIISRQPA